MKSPAGVGTGGSSGGEATETSLARHKPGLMLALARAEAGWPVHRLESFGNRPATSNGFRDATTDPDKLRKMFAEDGNVGTPGTERDLILDIDVPKVEERPDLTDDERCQVAADRLADLFERFAEVREAPLVMTPSGGFHVYLTLPERYIGAQRGEPGFIVTGKFPRSVPESERWGDVRGMVRACVAVWGCERPDGIYSPVREPEGPGKAPEAPEELIVWINASRAPNSNAEGDAPDIPVPQGGTRVVADPERYARGLLDGVRDRLGSVQSGRNVACFQEALTLGRWIGGYQHAGLPCLTAQDGYAALIDAMEANGDYADDPRKAEGTIRNGLRAGMASAYTVAEKPGRGHDDPRVQPRPEANRGGETVRSRGSSGTKGETSQPAHGNVPAPPDLALLDLPQDDLGYAFSIARQHYPEFRQHVGLGSLVYLPAEGRHVTGEAATARAHEFAILTQRSIAATAQQVDDRAERGRWEAYAKQLRSRSKREAALDLMLRTHVIATDAEIDGHALEINTPDGVLDLRTLELRPHDAVRIFTTVTRARYRPSAAHAAVDAVLGLLHEDGRAEYVQRVLGQALTGRNNRAMFIFVGPKATGKTTLGEGLLSAVGPDLGVPVDPATLLEVGRSRNAGAPRSDLVALRAARLALTSEPNRRSRLDGETVKRMTGLDTITARGVHMREPISFRPAFTVVMLANEVPAADWQDDALLSRLKLVPFRARPPKVDPRVREALVDDPDQEALDALFTWAVAGAHAWIRDGYSMGAEPEAVTNATRTYRVENDPFALWAEDRLRFDQADAKTTVSDLHADYTEWAGRNGVTEPQRVEALGKWLKARAEDGAQLERKRTKAGSVWRGVRIAGPTG